MEILDEPLSPVRESRKGPEFITWRNGSILTYVREVEDSLALYGATLEDSSWGITRLSPEDETDRGGPIGTASSRWNRPGLAYWKGSGETGDLCWTWLDNPSWEDYVLGPVLSGSTPVRWAPDGRHLIYTLAVDEIPQLFVLGTESGSSQQITSLSGGIVNPVAFLSPESGALIIGGVVDQTELHLFRLDGEFNAVPIETRTAPESEIALDYRKLGSPEAFEFDGRIWISAEVIRREPGNVPDARICLLEVLTDGPALDIRVDDGAPDVRRADPVALERFLGAEVDRVRRPDQLD